MLLKRGFTLIEMLVVVAIIAILALMALPSPDPAIARKQVTESMALIDDYQKLVVFYHQSAQAFLKDNQEAGIPPADKLLGNYVDRIDLINGAFHIHFGNKAHPEIKNKTLSVRPIVVIGSPQSPISWICGKAAAPAGMEAVGENRTDIEVKSLPLNCRI
ncbi:pilin [Cellvibrio sp. KY-GH-1]|uniref:pilin n=1 Tax=Cellvibrio sp. KY-GH-1 TaxID=2303332 RepID=UPI001247FE0A|nr:prepilin-type N-terminal cleavage/methylation domain-containing protein [Cellvibrio sp. KY-GH-1]QEY15038.1 pilin [Cellvibrio sp. KY-GH-1]